MATELYDNNWEKIFAKSQSDADYWNKARTVGRLYRDNIEILLHCIAIIEDFYDPSEMKMSDLAQCYKDYIKKLSKDELLSFIQKISDYAELYRDKLGEFDSNTYYKYSDDEFLERLMHIIDVLDITTFLPYILHLLYNKSQSGDNVFKEKCLELERYMLLHAICGESTKNYNKECVQLIKGSSTISSLLQNCENISIDKYLYGLKHIKNNKLASLLLFWIELYKRSVANTEIKKMVFSFTLEHIMPQKWNEYWSIQTLRVIDDSGKTIVDETKAGEIRQAAIYEIGNMTLLNSRLNTSLRNYEFKRKVHGDNRKKGMNQLADCLITREILELPEWNEQTIKKRTNELSDILLSIWKLF